MYKIFVDGLYVGTMDLSVDEIKLLNNDKDIKIIREENKTK